MSAPIHPQDSDTINAIEAIRAKNNSFWIKILKIALKESPVETKQILREIIVHDKAITKSIEELIVHENRR